MNGSRFECKDQQRISDAVLLQQTYEGDQQAFEVLVKRYQNLLYRLACFYVTSEQAKDVVQFTFIQLYTAFSGVLVEQGSASQSPSLKGWLMQVTRNRCRDVIRSHKRSALLFSEMGEDVPHNNISLLDEMLDPQPSPEQLFEEAEMRSQVYHALLTLSPRFRAVVWLRYREDMTFAEIGRRLHMPLSTAKTYYYRALARLRCKLSPAHTLLSL